MKKIIRCLTALIAFAMLLSLCSCIVITLPKRSNAEVERPSSYVITEEIKNIKIDWISGNVRIYSDGGDSIGIDETAKGILAENEKMDVSVEDDTLEIKFCKDHFFKNINHDKNLIIVLPEKIAKSLKTVSLSSTSADYTAEGISCEELNLNTISGDMSIKAKSSVLNCKTVSGDINFSGSIFEEATSNSVSGEVTFDIPEGVGFSAKFTSISGDFSCKIPAELDNGRYISGDGTVKIEMNSVSGDAQLK